ncbi:hypothetical protein G7054_g10759 [Neopestalotiopsis clavispora]|nr:hypothetical protein G7054_g10759 [Neopestalotiopsis clavispora]
MHFTTALVGLFALGSVTAATLRLPQGLADGHYSGDGTIDPKTGFAQYTYLGPIDDDALDNITLKDRGEDSGDLVYARGPTTGIKCNNRGSGDSVSAAQKAFVQKYDGVKFSDAWRKTLKGSTQAL